MTERIIALIRGPSGSGKTYALSKLPNAIFFDADIGGAEAYVTWMEEIGTKRVPVATYDEVIHHVRKNLKTGVSNLIIDPVTVLDHNTQVAANPTGEPDYGRSSKMARTRWQQLRELVRNHGFNLFVVSHQKDKYFGDKVVGHVADGPKNIEADFNVVLDVVPPAEGRPRKGRISQARVEKWRRHPDDPRGEVPDTFPWTIEGLESIAGFKLSEDREAEKPTEELLEAYREAYKKSPPPPKVQAKWDSVPEEALSAEDMQKRLDFLKREEF